MSTIIHKFQDEKNCLNETDVNERQTSGFLLLDGLKSKLSETLSSQERIEIERYSKVRIRTVNNFEMETIAENILIFNGSFPMFSNSTYPFKK